MPPRIAPTMGSDDALARLNARFNASFLPDLPSGPLPPTLSPATRLLLASAESPPIEHFDCIVVGGGIAGLHFASELSRRSADMGETRSIALLERETRLGGRVFDVEMEGAAEAVGLGAWRFKESDKRMKALAARHGIAYSGWDVTEVLVETRGATARTPAELRASCFPSVDQLYRERGPSFDLVKDMVARVLADPDGIPARHGNMASFVSAEYGPEACEYLKTTYGAWTAHMFSADLGYIVARWFAYPWGASKEFRPRGGLKEFIDALERECRSCGVAIRTGDAVVSIDKADPAPDGSPRYLVETAAGRLVTCGTLVVTLTPAQIRGVRSRLFAEHLLTQPIFRALGAARAFKAAMSFSEPWWEPELSQAALAKAEGAPVIDVKAGEPPPYANGDAPADTDTEYPALSSKSTALGLVLPYRSHPSGPHVLHAAYTDDPLAYATVAPLLHSPELVEGFLAGQLRAAFPAKTIPSPISTVYAAWDEGSYHYQRPGSRFAAEAYAGWAPRALGDGERFALAGESWGARRAWCEGALESAEAALGRLYG